MKYGLLRKGKHKFSKLIQSCNDEVVKAYLETKLKDFFDKKDGWIEQWLYNKSPEEIYLEFCGFVKGGGDTEELTTWKEYLESYG